MCWNWQNRQEATIRVAIYANVNTANNGKTSDANTEVRELHRAPVSTEVLASAAIHLGTFA